MAKVNVNTMINWQNGQIVTAEAIKQDREIIVVAINDNYERVKELEENTQVSLPKEASWEATQGQFQFTLTQGTFPETPNILEVSLEGFVLTEGEEFTKINDTTIELSEGVDAGSRVYARWYDVRSLKLFTDDLAVYNIMGVF